MYDITRIHTAFETLKEDYAARKVPILIDIISIGSASLIIKHGLIRATEDIDILDTSLRPAIANGMASAFAGKGFHIVSEVLARLHPDYASRCEPLYDSEIGFRIMKLSDLDIAISKIGRGHPKDFEDLFNSRILAELSLEQLKEEYFDAATYWIGDPKLIAWNFEAFLDQYQSREVIVEATKTIETSSTLSR